MTCHRCAAVDVALEAVLEQASEWRRKAELWDVLNQRVAELPDLMIRYRPASVGVCAEVKIGFGELDTFGTDAAETLLHCLKRDPS